MDEQPYPFEANESTFVYRFESVSTAWLIQFEPNQLYYGFLIRKRT